MKPIISSRIAGVIYALAIGTFGFLHFKNADAMICIGTDSLSSNWHLSMIEEMKTIFCDNYLCDSEAVETVPVSIRRSGDSKRKFCATCYEAYVSGVQHGRISENPNAYRSQFVLAD